MRTLFINALRLIGNRTAMGRYIELLAQEWSTTSVPFDKIVLLSPVKVQLDSLGTTTPVELRITSRPFNRRWPNLVWEQIILPFTARHAAMLFCPSYTCPLIYPGRIVLANHGIYESIPTEFSRLARLRGTLVNQASVGRADRVLANTQATKQDIIKYFKARPSKIEVIYPSIQAEYFQTYSAESIAEEVVQFLGANVPFVIFVGKLSKRRNVPNLIKAFTIVRREQNLTHRLLIVGPNTSDLPLEQLIAEAGGPNVIKYVPYGETQTLAKLYAAADVFALPTIKEGLSWTILGAMASGAAVLTVDHEALVESGEDAVLHVPTPSVDDLVDGLRRLLTDPALRREYVQKGRVRAAQFSGHACAESTMKILDQVALPSDR